MRTGQDHIRTGSMSDVKIMVLELISVYTLFLNPIDDLKTSYKTDWIYNHFAVLSYVTAMTYIISTVDLVL